MYMAFSWLCCFMAQMNPLFGPRLHQSTILMIAREWGDMPADIKGYEPKNFNATIKEE